MIDNNAKTSLRVEGELSLDDLSQIAGGTALDMLNPASAFDGGALLAGSDNMFTAVGAQGTQDPALTGATALNTSLMFP